MKLNWDFIADDRYPIHVCCCGLSVLCHNTEKDKARKKYMNDKGHGVALKNSPFRMLREHERNDKEGTCNNCGFYYRSVLVEPDWDINTECLPYGRKFDAIEVNREKYKKLRRNRHILSYMGAGA